MIFWDIDGVLRDLAKKIFGKQPLSWNQKVKGMDFVEYVNEHLELLFDAPRTEYAKVAYKFEPLTILSDQPLSWREWTKRWLEFWGFKVEKLIFAEAKRKPFYLNQGDWLIEDSPRLPFDFYRQVLLIDRPYNRGLKAPFRICKPKELETVLTSIVRNSDG